MFVCLNMDVGCVHAYVIILFIKLTFYFYSFQKSLMVPSWTGIAWKFMKLTTPTHKTQSHMTQGIYVSWTQNKWYWMINMWVTFKKWLLIAFIIRGQSFACFLHALRLATWRNVCSVFALCERGNRTHLHV